MYYFWTDSPKKCSLMKQVRMYYRSGTGGRCCIGAGKTLSVHCQAAAHFSLKLRHGRHLEITINQKSDYVKNICAKFHPSQILKRRSLRRF